jgi:hypothetical protein
LLLLTVLLTVLLIILLIFSAAAAALSAASQRFMSPLNELRRRFRPVFPEAPDRQTVTTAVPVTES